MSTILPPGAQAPPPQPAATAQAAPTQTQAFPVQLALTGTVTGQSTTAQPTIQAAAGTLQLATPANLPAGTTVTIEVLTQSAPRADTVGGATGTAPPPSPEPHTD